MRLALVAAAALELAADCLECGKVQIYQALAAGQQLVDGSVLQDIAIHVSRSFGERRENPLQLKRHTLVCSMGAPKLSSIKLSPEKGSEGSRGEDGMSARVV